MSFIKIERELIKSGLSARSILCYALLADRLSLSKANGWEDERGYFILYSYTKLSEALGIQRCRTIRIMNELRNNKLIETVRSAGNANKIYILPVPENFQVLSSSASTDTLDLERLIDQAASLENVFMDQNKRQQVLDRILPRIDTVKNRFGYIRKVLRNWDSSDNSAELNAPSYDLDEYKSHNTILEEDMNIFDY